jgi:hypothetical protein
MSTTTIKPSIQRIEKNPAGWPEEVLPLFEQAITCEFATLTRAGVPITQPLTPYLGEDEQTLDVSTGLTYPAKAERARRNPKVGMLYSDAVSSGLDRPPVILVYGYAAVRDADLQANTDRYLKQSLVKSPAGFKGAPGFVLKRLPWYFVRIWIQVMPVRILWWPDGDMDVAPKVWNAPTDFVPRASDPAPQGKQPAPWKEPPSDWRTNAEHAVKMLGLPILTTVDADGFPQSLRVKNVALNTSEFVLELPLGAPLVQDGAACLTFHAHPQIFSGQENRTFLGSVTRQGDNAIRFTVERPLADWSLAGSRVGAALAFFDSGRRLRPRLQAEAARRGQPVPTIQVPDFW